MTKKRKIKIFYSWLSGEIPATTNKDAIRTSLKEVKKRLEAKYGKHNLEIYIDEATRGQPGSPNIVDKIFLKIREADIFVGDLTTIVASTKKSRACPNPNVVFELGFARALLGWDRIITLFNTKKGRDLSDLPFDYSQNRVSPYSIKSKKDQNGKNNLTSLLFTAIKLIIEKDPVKENDLIGYSKEEIERKRDIENLSWILRQIHIQTLENFVVESPRTLSVQADDFLDNFTAVFESRMFSLYDRDFLRPIKQIATSWQKCGIYGKYDFHTESTYIFAKPAGGFQTEQLNDLDRISEERRKIGNALSLLVRKIKTKFPEIDLHATSQVALQEHIDFVDTIRSS